MRFYKSLIIGICMISLLLSGCITIKMKDDSAKSLSDPILGEWEMTRTGIQPDLPIPELLVNQVINEKATWKFQRNNGVLTLRFDGRDTWYKSPIGIKIDKKATNVSETSGQAPYVFTGGGAINLDDATGIISQFTGHNIEQLNLSFNDEILISWISTYSSIRATIKVNTTGNYYGESASGTMKSETINHSMSIYYEGKKK